MPPWPVAFAPFLPGVASVVSTQPDTRATGRLALVPGSVQVSTACDLIAGFVARHKAGTRPAGGGYKQVRPAADLVYYFLQPHRAGESIQDKSQDDRLYICHQPAYD